MAGKRSKKVTSRSKSAPRRGRSKNKSLLHRILTFKNLPPIAFIAIFAGVGTYLLWTSFAASPSGPPRPFIDVPERGLIWAGLKAPQAGGACGHLYELVGNHGHRPLCTHGPDPAPEDVDVRDGIAQDTASTGSTAATEPIYPPIPCDGDGASGNRVQGLYVRASDVPSRLNTIVENNRTVAENLQKYAERANNQYLKSAQQTGVDRNIRWAHDAICKPIIPEVVISPTGDDTFGNTVSELKNLGYNRADRKYMLWVDAEVYCGIGTIYGDDSPDSSNINNGTYQSYGRSDSGCWNYSEAHELMHNLGGVQPSAPHATKGWHCTDESDEMCYIDGSGIVMTNSCPSVNSQSTLFDCNHDDYFYAGVPPIGNYLSTHWNIANSSFLIGGGTPPILVQCNNRVDDDGDGKIDHPNDPGCSGSSDTSESPDPPPPPPPLDTIAPTATITKPTNNAKIKSRVDISAHGLDNKGIKKMEVYIDDVLKVTYTYPYITYTWSAGKAKAGPHSITIKAYDAANNMGQSSITVYK